jgi:ParB family chromosome partitioning protein
MVSFKKKNIPIERVAAAEYAATATPIVGDPRLNALPPNQGSAISPDNLYLGSSQGLVGHANSYEIGKVYDVPVGLVKSNPFNPRVIYTTTAVDEMSLSLLTHKQRISATGYIDDQGDVVLIEGETRLRGARSAGLPTLRIEIRPRPTGDRELYEEARAANVERRDQSPLDDALKWKELLAKKIYPTQVALAKALNLGEDHVSRTLSLATLPHRIIHACAEIPELLTHKMLNAIREYWDVKGDDSTLELIFEAGKTGMGYRDVASRRKAAENGPIKRTRSTKEVLSYRGAKGELKSFSDDGRVELSLKGLSVKDAEEITAKIMSLFPKELV